MDKINCFNEDNYLFSNNLEAASHIYKIKDEYVEEIKKNAKKYGSNIQAYDEYISFIAYLVKCLGIPKDTLNISMILGLITKMGIFSDNHSFVKHNSRNDIAGFLGINVVRGQAVCRHIASFQSDVLKKLNLMSEPFYCYLSNVMINDANEKEANHAINLIEYSDNLYGYDAFNNGFFEFTGDRELRELFTHKVHYLYYKPYWHMILDGMNASNVTNMISIFGKIKDRNAISPESYKYICENATNAVNKNMELLEDFHESSKKYIKRITKNL